MLYNDDRILFFDTRHIDSLESAKLTMNPPEKRGPCMVIEKDWELGVHRASTILFWNGEYRLYYSGSLGEHESTRTLAFAVSKDGITWERPDLGVVEFNGSRANNICEVRGGRPHETCVFIDPTGPDEHRFKVVCHRPFEGMFLLSSPDGIHFKRAEGLLLPFGTDNHMTAFYDESIGRYRIYCRGGDRDREIMGWKGSRMVVYGETDDMFRPIPYDANAPDPSDYGIERPGPDGDIVRPLPGINKELPAVMKMDSLDPPEADMYQPAAVHYAPGAYLAFPTLYYHYPGTDQGGFRNDGILDIQFAASRDGVLWTRDFRGSYVRLDLPDGPCTKQMHMLVGMVPHQYTLSQYYVGSRRSHGEGRTEDNPKGIGFHEPKMGDPLALRLEQRVDGFVSVDTDYTGGSLLTALFIVQSPEIKLNIDTSASGVARAALLDETGREVPGCRLEESDRIQGNDTTYVLSWRGGRDVSHLVGRQVRLLVKSRNTKLFAVYP